MSKSKATTKASKATDKVLSKVKDAGVTKASQSPKAKSKEIARKVKAKEEKASRKKKEPTPSSSSESEDSDEEIKDAPIESESEEEAENAESSGSESESDSSESESESEEETKSKPATKKAEPKKVTKKAESSESSESSESESESESEPEEEIKKPETKKAEPKKASKKDGSSDESDSESEEESDSDSDSSESEEESEDSKPSKKRKADEEPASNAKKTKTEAADNSPNLFVGNLSWNVDEEWLRREFEEFGELAGVRIMTERESGRSRGFGYVEYADAASAKAAYESKKDAEIDGRTINLDYAKPRDSSNQQNPRDRAQSRARSYGDQTSPESSTLFLGNLAFSTNEDAVREVFQEKGSILGIRLPTDPESGRPKGFGYIEFSSVDEARQALNDLQGADLGGRPLRLDYSTPRPQGDGNRGGRGGRGGSRGGRGRGGFGGRGRGGPSGANSTNRGGFGDFSGKKVTFD